MQSSLSHSGWGVLYVSSEVNQTKPDRKYLIRVSLYPFVGDIVMTLLGQPMSYWSGDFSSKNEVNPIGAEFLQWHPLAFLGGAVLYAILFSGAIYVLPKLLAWWISVGLLLAHAGGMKSWIPYFSSWDSYSSWEGVLNSILAVFATWCFLGAAQSANKSE